MDDEKKMTIDLPFSHEEMLQESEQRNQMSNENLRPFEYILKEIEGEELEDLHPVKVGTLQWLINDYIETKDDLRRRDQQYFEMKRLIKGLLDATKEPIE